MFTLIEPGVFVSAQFDQDGLALAREQYLNKSIRDDKVSETCRQETSCVPSHTDSGSLWNSCSSWSQLCLPGKNCCFRCPRCLFSVTIQDAGSGGPHLPSSFEHRLKWSISNLLSVLCVNVLRVNRDFEQDECELPRTCFIPLHHVDAPWF